MGPRRWSRGRAPGPPTTTGPRTSFNGATAMEPWKSRRSAWPPSRQRPASMGPRRWSRGRGNAATPRFRPRYCFNGATAMEPWKRSIPAGSRSASRSFNGATAMEPWKRPERNRSRRSWDRFNGATAMEPWKSVEGIVRGKRPAAASMGPRRWSRGRDGRAAGKRPHQSASMGPRRWSRGRGAGGSEACDSGDSASMGPRRWSRGRAVEPISRHPVRIRFNGATAMEPWKSPRFRSETPKRLLLQWGHGDGAVEEGPPPGPFGAKDLGPGLREGRPARVSNRSRARATKS